MGITFNAIFMSKKTFSTFMQGVIDSLHQSGKYRISETYATTLRSFQRFCQGKDITLSQIDAHLMMAYESYLLSIGLAPNTCSFYLRCMRAVYNRAVDRRLVTQCHPFKSVYTGVARTAKRAVPLDVVRCLKELDLSDTPYLDFARNMFLFSFYMRGMSFVDMAYLRKKNLNGGVLSYRRRKTGQMLYIGWERCMQQLVDKYDTGTSPYLLPIITRPGVEERKQYLYVSHNVNRSLKILGERLGLSIPLTLYVARHTWASVAYSKHIPLSVISEGMGHDSETTTRIYLASLDNVEVDKANRIVLDSL